jgi:hypothetical protein
MANPYNGKLFIIYSNVSDLKLHPSIYLNYRPETQRYILTICTCCLYSAVRSGFDGGKSITGAHKLDNVIIGITQPLITMGENTR